MVAPLIAGAARAAAGTARTTRAASVSVGKAGKGGVANTVEPAGRIMYGGRLERDLRKVKENGVLYGGRAARDFRSKASSSAVSMGGDLMEKAKAVRASWIIGVFVLPFYPIHLIFGFVQLAGYATEYAGEQLLWGLGALVLPGQTVFAAGFIMTALFGIASMFIAAFMYTFQNVHWWRGHGLLSFILCTVLCLVPMLNIFPWLIAWMLVVIGAQRKK